MEFATKMCECLPWSLSTKIAAVEVLQNRATQCQGWGPLALCLTMVPLSITVPPCTILNRKKTYMGFQWKVFPLFKIVCCRGGGHDQEQNHKILAPLPMVLFPAEICQQV